MKRWKYDAENPCPTCGSGETLVKDSRRLPQQRVRYRRRVCRACQRVWTTYEIDAGTMQFLRRCQQFLLALDTSLDSVREVVDSFRDAEQVRGKP
jgi:hypothetical protein